MPKVRTESSEFRKPAERIHRDGAYEQGPYGERLSPSAADAIRNSPAGRHVRAIALERHDPTIEKRYVATLGGFSDFTPPDSHEAKAKGAEDVAAGKGDYGRAKQMLAEARDREHRQVHGYLKTAYQDEAHRQGEQARKLITGFFHEREAHLLKDPRIEDLTKTHERIRVGKAELETMEAGSPDAKVLQEELDRAEKGLKIQFHQVFGREGEDAYRKVVHDTRDLGREHRALERLKDIKASGKPILGVQIREQEIRLQKAFTEAFGGDGARMFIAYQAGDKGGREALARRAEHQQAEIALRECLLEKNQTILETERREAATIRAEQAMQILDAPDRRGALALMTRRAGGREELEAQLAALYYNPSPKDPPASGKGLETTLWVNAHSGGRNPAPPLDENKRLQANEAMAWLGIPESDQVIQRAWRESIETINQAEQKGVAWSAAEARLEIIQTEGGWVKDLKDRQVHQADYAAKDLKDARSNLLLLYHPEAAMSETQQAETLQALEKGRPASKGFETADIRHQWDTYHKAKDRVERVDSEHHEACTRLAGEFVFRANKLDPDMIAKAGGAVRVQEALAGALESRSEEDPALSAVLAKHGGGSPEDWADVARTLKAEQKPTNDLESDALVKAGQAAHREREFRETAAKLDGLDWTKVEDRIVYYRGMDYLNRVKMYEKELENWAGDKWFEAKALWTSRIMQQSRGVVVGVGHSLALAGRTMAEAGKAAWEMGQGGIQGIIALTKAQEAVARGELTDAAGGVMEGATRLGGVAVRPVSVGVSAIKDGYATSQTLRDLPEKIRERDERGMRLYKIQDDLLAKRAEEAKEHSQKGGELVFNYVQASRDATDYAERYATSKDPEERNHLEKGIEQAQDLMDMNLRRLQEEFPELEPGLREHGSLGPKGIQRAIERIKNASPDAYARLNRDLPAFGLPCDGKHGEAAPFVDLGRIGPNNDGRLVASSSNGMVSLGVMELDGQGDGKSGCYLGKMPAEKLSYWLDQWEKHGKGKVIPSGKNIVDLPVQDRVEDPEERERRVSYWRTACALDEAGIKSSQVAALKDLQHLHEKLGGRLDGFTTKNPYHDGLARGLNANLRSDDGMGLMVDPEVEVRNGKREVERALEHVQRRTAMEMQSFIQGLLAQQAGDTGAEIKDAMDANNEEFGW